MLFPVWLCTIDFLNPTALPPWDAKVIDFSGGYSGLHLIQHVEIRDGLITFFFQGGCLGDVGEGLRCVILWRRCRILLVMFIFSLFSYLQVVYLLLTVFEWKFMMTWSSFSRKQPLYLRSVYILPSSHPTCRITYILAIVDHLFQVNSTSAVDCWSKGDTSAAAAK